MADPEQEQDLEQVARDTEDELMKGAFEPKADKLEEKAPEPEAKTEQPSEPEKGERLRDPATGKFVSKDAKGEESQQPAPAEPAKEDEILPSWRAREINEERRQVQAELERTRVELARAQAWAQQQQRQAQPAQEPAAPDPLLDTPAYTKFVQEQMRAEFAQQRALDRLDMKLELAHARHGERFEKAYEALLVEKQRGNQALVHHLTSQANPGEAIVRWHTQNEVLREVGPDPAAYKQKTQQATREQLLNDPEFRAQAEAHWREQAMGNSGQPSRPNTVVRMPPSLSKATGSSEIPQTSTDGSEAALFNYAMQPKRR